MIYTIAFDSTEAGGYRALACVLIESLLAHGAKAILVFHNQESREFCRKYPSVKDVYVAGAPDRNEAICFKYDAEKFIDGNVHDNVTFIDSDSIVLKPLDDLFDGDWDILYAREWQFKMNSRYHNG